VIDALVARAVELRPRAVRTAGEFTQRAFLNDKLDLAQAEAIAISSTRARARRCAPPCARCRGSSPPWWHGLTEAVIELRTYIEAAIDFPEEEIDFLAITSSARASRRCATISRACSRVRPGPFAARGHDGGHRRPAERGKSSLLNRLAGYDAAIVDGHSRTTRDVVRERIHLDGMPLHVLDTAGLREGGDLVEEEGMRAPRRRLQRADRVLFVIDAVEDPSATAFRDRARAAAGGCSGSRWCSNKCDLAVGLPVADTLTRPPYITLSALTGQGLQDLRAHLKQCMGYQTVDGGAISARRRHLEGPRAGTRAHRRSRAPAHRAPCRGTGRRGAARRAAGLERDHGEFTQRGSAGADIRRVLHRKNDRGR